MNLYPLSRVQNGHCMADVRRWRRQSACLWQRAGGWRAVPCRAAGYDEDGWMDVSGAHNGRAAAAEADTQRPATPRDNAAAATTTWRFNHWAASLISLCDTPLVMHSTVCVCVCVTHSTVSNDSFHYVSLLQRLDQKLNDEEKANQQKIMKENDYLIAELFSRSSIEKDGIEFFLAYFCMSSSSSAILHKKGWRRVVSLSNDHDLPLLQPLRWSSSQSIWWCHPSNAGVDVHDFCSLVHILEPFPSADFWVLYVLATNCVQSIELS